LVPRKNDGPHYLGNGRCLSIVLQTILRLRTRKVD
jgi:hypothetical protein